MKTIAKWLAVSWILKSSYAGMFLLMLAEGPVVIAFGGFGAKVGLFNVWLVLLLSVLGNFLPDFLCYGIGYYGRVWFINKLGKWLGITRERMAKVQTLYADHPFMTLFVVKTIPFLAPSGLAAAGAVRMPIGKFAFWSLIITIPSSGLYFLIGYLAGEGYARIVHYQEWALAVIAIVIVVAVIAYSKFMAKLGRKLAPSGLRDN
jgi:membrane protein DedA with SNARE-associated domain